MDILDLLAADHRDVQASFAEYRRLAEKAFHSKQSVSARGFDVLETHLRLEEELFYPEIETSAETADAVRDAHAMHEQIRLLLRDLLETGPTDGTFDTRMSALEELVAEHVAEEEEEIFPAARVLLGDARLEELGSRAEAMRAELEAPAPDGEEPPIPPVTRL